MTINTLYLQPAANILEAGSDVHNERHGRFSKKEKILKLKVELKKVFLVRDETPYFSDALGFSLLSPLVNPVLSRRVGHW